MSQTSANVLIVDDQVSIRTSLSLLLGEMGFCVRTATDGLSALRKVRQEIPDILLSDLNMPGMSGFELLLVVRRRFPAILVIAMSGAFAGKQVPAGVAADAFYQKGSNAIELVRLLRRPPAVKRPAFPIPRTVVPLCGRSGMLTCPECLRAFVLAPKGIGGVRGEAECVHCGYSIQYATGELADQMPEEHCSKG